MAKYQEISAALPDLRTDLLRKQLDEAAQPAAAMAFAARGAFSAYATPVNNIHATSVGIRLAGDQYRPDEFVLKMFVFDTVDQDQSSVPLPKQW